MFRQCLGIYLTLQNTLTVHDVLRLSFTKEMSSVLVVTTFQQKSLFKKYVLTINFIVIYFCYAHA